MKNKYTEIDIDAIRSGDVVMIYDRCYGSHLIHQLVKNYDPNYIGFVTKIGDEKIVVYFKNLEDGFIIRTFDELTEKENLKICGIYRKPNFKNTDELIRWINKDILVSRSPEYDTLINTINIYGTKQNVSWNLKYFSLLHNVFKFTNIDGAEYDDVGLVGFYFKLFWENIEWRID